jgi:hypothetical protein
MINVIYVQQIFLVVFIVLINQHVLNVMQVIFLHYYNNVIFVNHQYKDVYIVMIKHIVFNVEQDII